MSSEQSRRTKPKVIFNGTDISTDIEPYLKSLTYVDYEEDKADDLQLELQDRDGVWLKSWLNSTDVKGSTLEAVIVRKNWHGDNKDDVLDCGSFELDNISVSGPPSKVTIKATGLPFTSAARTQKKTKAWEKIRLSGIANEIASGAGMRCMFESSYDPLYERREQIQESDIAFLKRLCKAAGISLKVTNGIIVLFEASTYEQKEAVRTISPGNEVLSYSFSTNFHDTDYASCHVSYTDPLTQTTYEYTYTPKDADSSGQVLEINEKVSSKDEAKKLAQKRLREKNKNTFAASFTLVGDPSLVAGVTVIVSGYGLFDGKYIIEQATHTVSGGYKVSVTLRQVLEGY